MNCGSPCLKLVDNFRFRWYGTAGCGGVVLRRSAALLFAAMGNSGAELVAADIGIAVRKAGACCALNYFFTGDGCGSIPMSLEVTAPGEGAALLGSADEAVINVGGGAYVFAAGRVFDAADKSCEDVSDTPSYLLFPAP